MLLDRLLVRDKLNLLVVLPLTAVVLTAVPFVAERVDDARDASAAAGAALDARRIGGLIQELQRERLVSVAYLATPATRRGVVVSQGQRVTDTAADVRAELGTGLTVSLAAALDSLRELTGVRSAVAVRASDPAAVVQAYGEAILRLVDALQLSAVATSGGAGAQEVQALDALLRANERSSGAGAALVATTVVVPGRPAREDRLVDAAAASRLEGDRFRRLASAEQVRLLDSVERGSAALRVEALTSGVRAGPTGTGPERVAELAAAVESQTGLRRLVQDRIVRDIAQEAGAAARGARTAAAIVALLAALLFGLVLTLSVVVGRSIARPLQRLTKAAGSVADLARAELVRVSDEDAADEQVPRLAAIRVQSQDEIGDLAAAFNRVQATAALLLERQVVSRRNVASMFATVGRRTQNLAGRQLSLIDRLERDEQDPDVLAKLYRLDHVSTRLRRGANSLLVLSGARADDPLATPRPLADLLRSALGEIEGFQQVRLGTIADVTIAPEAAADIALVLAELLENATSFSPPGRPVDVLASAGSGGGCRIVVADHGIGLSSERLAEENARLLERERLDLVATSVLGLFVVGRLSRRHGLSVVLSGTEGGGVTATVDIPAGLVRATAPAGSALALSPAESPTGDSVRPQAQGASVDGPTVALPAIPAARSGDFSWFDLLPEPWPALGNGRATPALPPPRTTSSGAVPERTEPVDPGSAADEPGRIGLTRRVPGAQLPAPGDPMPSRDAHRVQDPAVVRQAMEAFESGVTRAGARAADPDGRTPAPHPPPPAPAPAPPRSAPPTPAPPRPAPPTPAVQAPTASVGSDSSRSAGGATRSGLARRVPGAHLAASVREDGARTRHRPADGPAARAGRSASPDRPGGRASAEQQAAAARAMIDAFESGVARAVQSDDTSQAPIREAQR